MPHRAPLLSPALALSLFVSLPMTAPAISVNPIDASLPLSVHTRVLCTSGTANPPPTTGTERATCFFSGTTGGTSLPLIEVLGTGTAEADLATGVLRGRSTAQAYNNPPDLIRIGGFSDAQLYDTLSIDVPAGQSVPVELRLTVDGAFLTDEANPNTQANEVNGLLRGIREVGTQFGASGVTIEQGNDGRVFVTNSGFVGNAAFTTGANPQGLFADPADVQFALSVFFMATPAEPAFTFYASLLTTSGLGFTDESPAIKNTSVDFGNTGQLAVIVPAGTSWRSASGAFLVPEPGSAVLLGGALAVLIGARKILRA